MAKAIEKTERYYAPDRAAWREWLQRHHATSKGIWLVYYKKESGKSRVAYADAVEEALCFGWIDSTFNPIDDDSFMQLFTPRKPKSVWSKLNKERVEQLMANGLMTPAGMEKINDAKKQGNWNAIDHVEAFVIPPELEQVFTESEKARTFFDSLSKTNRKMILYYISNARQPVTRQKRAEEMGSALKDGMLPQRYIVAKKANDK